MHVSYGPDGCNNIYKSTVNSVNTNKHQLLTRLLCFLESSFGKFSPKNRTLTQHVPAVQMQKTISCCQACPSGCRKRSPIKSPNFLTLGFMCSSDDISASRIQDNPFNFLWSNTQRTTAWRPSLWRSKAFDGKIREVCHIDTIDMAVVFLESSYETTIHVSISWNISCAVPTKGKDWKRLKFRRATKEKKHKTGWFIRILVVIY